MEHSVIERVFKKYDIRGFAGKEINEELAYALGNGFARKYELKECLVGRDARESSPGLAKALINGIIDAGCDVVDVGVVSTPLMKWVAAEKSLAGGIMVSASHNPAAYNGFKFYERGALPIGQDHGLHELKEWLKPEKRGAGKVSEQSYLDEYIDFVLGFYSTSEREVFIDASGGGACQEVKRLAEKGSLNLVLYNVEEDPKFSVHPPDPLNPEATEAAREYCGMNKCVGVVLDGDADRVMFIDEDGHAISADIFGAWLADFLLSEGDGATATVRDSRAMRDVAKKHGARFKLSPVGHAYIHRAMVQDDLHIGTEKSGHLFLREAHYSECPLLCLMLTLKHLEGTLSQAVRTIREAYITSPEYNYRVDDKEKVIERAKEHYKDKGSLVTIDGVLCEGPDWWVNIRPSNTEPLVRLTFEAKDKDTYDNLKEEAEELLKPFIKN